MSHCSPINTTSSEAFDLLNNLFKRVYILDIDSFIGEKKCEPCISSIFVVSQGSFSFELDNTECLIHNGTLAKLGNLQIVELQSAYTNNRQPELPKGKCVGMGYTCPICSKAAWVPHKQKIICCNGCKAMFTK